MLVPFVVDAESIVPDPTWTGSQIRACHNSLIKSWIDYGLLAYDGNSLEESNLYKHIITLPQNVRSNWLGALRRLPILPTPSWNSRVTPSLISEFSDVAKLAFIDDVQAEIEFNFDEASDHTYLKIGDSEVAVCRILNAAHAIAFRQASILSKSHIEAGDTFQQIWDLRFKSLAKAPIKKISIVDRFAIRNHFDTPQNQLSGIERFFRLLDKDATGDRYIKFYTTWPEELQSGNKVSLEEIEFEFRHIFDRLLHKKIKRINVFLVPNSGFRKDSHDRFIRFGDYVWDIGKGLEVFGAPFCKDRSQAAFKVIFFEEDSYMLVEQDLARNTKTRQINEIK